MYHLEKIPNHISVYIYSIECGKNGLKRCTPLTHAGLLEVWGFCFRFVCKLCAIFWQIMGQKSQIMHELSMRIAQCCTIFLSENFYCFSLLSLRIFFGFNFNTKLSIFQAKTRERKLFCRQINRGRVLFSFPSCEWLYLFQSWHMLYEKLEHRFQQPAAENTWNALLINGICESFLQWSSGYLLWKLTVFTVVW